MDNNQKHNQLVAAALKALEVAVVRVPQNHRYGAAVLTTKGSIFAGGNYFSSTFSLSVHAETAALIHAAAHGEPYIEAISIVSTEDPDGIQFCRPCGSCRQLIFENGRLSGFAVEVLMCSRAGKYERRPINELMPFPWPSGPPSTYPS